MGDRPICFAPGHQGAAKDGCHSPPWYVEAAPLDKCSALKQINKLDLATGLWAAARDIERSAN